MSKRGPRHATAGAAFLVGLGPGFTAGVDVDAVVETQRGPDLGRVLWSGRGGARHVAARRAVLGYTEKRRVLRAPRAGPSAAQSDIGRGGGPRRRDGDVDGEPVITPIAGLLRGVLKGRRCRSRPGTKVGDVDPRGPGVNAARISDKARAVAAGVLEAVLMRRRGLR